MRTPGAMEVWRSRTAVGADALQLCGFMARMQEIAGTFASDRKLLEPPHGTVNVIFQESGIGSFDERVRMAEPR
ncbi:hypothetical protein BH24CHL4_BH24CHL4_26200 [soil metagenome]